MDVMTEIARSAVLGIAATAVLVCALIVLAFCLELYEDHRAMRIATWTVVLFVYFVACGEFVRGL